jgi:hypothetical protein
MKRTTIVLVLMALVMLTGCADVAVVDACLTSDPYGFWGGLWHGIIAPISFFGSLFSDDIAMYAVNNSGGWYDFGFWLGMGTLGASSRGKGR